MSRAMGKEGNGGSIPYSQSACISRSVIDLDMILITYLVGELCFDIIQLALN